MKNINDIIFCPGGCGSYGKQLYIGFNKIECPVKGCPNFSEKQLKSLCNNDEDDTVKLKLNVKEFLKDHDQQNSSSSSSNTVSSPDSSVVTFDDLCKQYGAASIFGPWDGDLADNEEIDDSYPMDKD